VPVADKECPSISILFAARNEAENLPAALATLLAQDYPRYEVVAVDDRSEDATPQILDQFARTHKNLKVVHVAALPPGWLGKPHALQQGYEHASGEWLVFTDADVHFAPDVLRRAIAVARSKDWHHLTLLVQFDMAGFWESVTLTFFGLGFNLGVEPWQASRPESRRYVGVGAFQLVRRDVYEAIGTHRRLAMEVVDDMKLGKLVKQRSFRSGVGIAEQRVRLRWQVGLRNIIRGTTKNFFAAAGYSVGLIASQVSQLLVFSVVPFAALPFSGGMARVFAMIAVLVALALHAGVAWNSRVSPLYALTHPLGALIFCYMLLRSTVVTLWRRGVVWRDTFYPLAELRRGMV
jgi:glycosyltransferase involved in cell wall biosynthesis